LSAVLSTPLLLAVLMLPNRHGALILFVPSCAFIFFYVGVCYALLQVLSVAETRATVTAAVILGQTLFAGASLQFVGILSDELYSRAGADSLRWALIVTSLLPVWAAGHFWLAGRYFRNDPRLECME
jgi:hypothetical protein